MKRLRRGLAAALLALALGAAAEEAPAGNCPAAPAPLTRADLDAGLAQAEDAGFLWRATKDHRTSWLYGTIHVARKAWMFPGPHVQAALHASDEVALELDPTDPDIVARLQRAVSNPPGAPALPEALARRLEAQARAACVDPAELAALRPEMRAVTVALMAGRRLGLEPSYGVDVFLAVLARQQHKPLRSLETPEGQAAVIVSDDPRTTARRVGEALEELEGDAGPRILGRLAGDWQRGDLDDLAHYAQWCDCTRTAEERADFARMVQDRNGPMAEHIARWHAEGRALFVAVGSLHMVGPQGLPALLRERGFVVERIDFAH